MIIVSDTTTITSLLKINRIDLLHTLFGQVLIPEAVRDELLDYHAALPEWLEVKPVFDLNLIAQVTEKLDRGEAESIVLAKNIKADLLIIDERKGRKFAEQMGIECIGLGGILLLAKKRNLIDSLSAVFDQLENKANFYLGAAVRHKLLHAANEA